VAIVEGAQDGVPFRAYYKRMDTAERDAETTGGTVLDLRDLSRRRMVAGEWRDAE
jgi:hypothetical protein